MPRLLPGGAAAARRVRSSSERRNVYACLRPCRSPLASECDLVTPAFSLTPQVGHLHATRLTFLPAVAFDPAHLSVCDGRRIASPSSFRSCSANGVLAAWRPPRSAASRFFSRHHDSESSFLLPVEQQPLSGVQRASASAIEEACLTVAYAGDCSAWQGGVQ